MSGTDDLKYVNRSGVEHSGSIGWWQALGLTFVWSTRIREFLPLLVPPDNYGPAKCFLVVFPQKYNPFTEKRNLLLYTVSVLLYFPTIFIVPAVTINVGVLHGLVTLAACCFVYAALFAVSLVAYFRAGGWEQILEERE